jgi:proteasome lid subunit RPN8/RPN11
MWVAMRELAHDGIKRIEGICLWLGNRGEDGLAAITHSVLLRGSYIEKSALNITINPKLMREVHEKAQENKVSLIGQIHSHAENVGTNLSSVDRRYGISVPGYLSVVAPNYGLTEGTAINDCGVYTYVPEKGYIRLSWREVSKRIIIDHQMQHSTLIIG